MARPLRIEMNPLLVEELRHAPGIKRILGKLAQAVEDEALADPRSQSGSGVYASSFGSEVVEDAKGPKGVTYNTDPVAHWVEFGAHAGGKTPVLGYFILTRALDAVVGQGTLQHLMSDQEVDYGNA